MKIKWPVPNTKYPDLKIKDTLDYPNWHKEEEKIYRSLEENPPTLFELPKGWGHPWPDLPTPDDIYPEIDLSKIRFSTPRNRCAQPSLLGYYLSWHMIGVSFENENGRAPDNSNELIAYNENLPKENRYGIHICCKSIDSYIKKFNTDGIPQEHKDNYLEYCTFLTLLYVIAHEWGHYRSEVLSFQLSHLVKSVTGIDNSGLHPYYLSYFIFKKQYPESNFEEVFAEWAAIKLGIFNFYNKKPAFANNITNWPVVEATVKFMLTQAIARDTRIRPYSDIRHWVDIRNITNDEIMQRLSENKTSLNRSVNDNVNIKDIKSLKNGRMIDLLMHNQLQFSYEHLFNGFVRSAPLNYPKHPDSLFYHFADDECLLAKEGNATENFLRLSTPVYQDPKEEKESKILKVIKWLKEDNQNLAALPIKVFPEILPLNPVYFHV